MIPRSKILIVDDELSMRKQLEFMLKTENYDLTLLADGKELLEKLAEITPDLIILDLMLPEIDGFEVCRRIKANNQLQHIPIILVTVLDSKKVLGKGIEAGADDFLQKPVSKLELRARVRSMLRIKRQYDELQRMMRLREELSNMIVHDMSSPIISVLLHATLMEEKITDAQLLKHLEMIRMAADRLDSFVNDMLMLAKMEHHSLRLNPSMVDINQLVLDAEKHFSIIAHSKGIELKLALPEPPIRMSVDRNLFRRVIANLLANALQYSPSGTIVTLSLTVTHTDDDKPHLCMQVIDQGLGIPEAYRGRIFEKFEVVDLKKEGVPQIGLGLTFCKMAVDAHGGSIFVKPNHPQGSAFVVEI
ncbi:MAG: hybrid sensor histidine kinase/response regulator [Candidatus Parabeggiatoa sp. nov. 3]|nr:MAG: hybrid sensor histidine kinase/response regulator [Gammaproteobacteria bacterium]RKZ65346.1 MAG: hybrid sensor histidine kinase/response regulator [Gammaproteobacteria bacterium]RKZ85870.1 MAG: hybrid sensor histidine kinase/response regulator [Gammaproteobacteria bacterium]